MTLGTAAPLGARDPAHAVWLSSAATRASRFIDMADDL